MAKTKRPTPKITEHNATTGEIIIRDLTYEEMEVWLREHAEADIESEKVQARLEVYQALWDKLQTDKVDLKTVIELLRFMLPNRPEL